jgi:hypothetical protein
MRTSFKPNIKKNRNTGDLLAHRQCKLEKTGV